MLWRDQAAGAPAAAALLVFAGQAPSLARLPCFAPCNLHHDGICSGASRGAFVLSSIIRRDIFSGASPRRVATGPGGRGAAVGDSGARWPRARGTARRAAAGLAALPAGPRRAPRPRRPSRHGISMRCACGANALRMRVDRAAYSWSSRPWTTRPRRADRSPRPPTSRCLALWLAHRRPQRSQSWRGADRAGAPARPRRGCSPGRCASRRRPWSSTGRGATSCGCRSAACSSSTSRSPRTSRPTRRASRRWPPAPQTLRVCFCALPLWAGVYGWHARGGRGGAWPTARAVL